MTYNTRTHSVGAQNGAGTASGLVQHCGNGGQSMSDSNGTVRRRCRIHIMIMAAMTPRESRTIIHWAPFGSLDPSCIGCGSVMIVAFVLFKLRVNIIETRKNNINNDLTGHPSSVCSSTIVQTLVISRNVMASQIAR